MATTIEERISRLEAEMEELRKAQPVLASEKPWWERVYGMFQDSPDFEEATRLGREYRESQRPADEAPRSEAA